MTTFEAIKLLRQFSNLGDFIPLHPWNKKIKGVNRGKTPIHLEWQIKKYNQGDEILKKWIKRNFNVGFRLKNQIVIIDIDPRNFKNIDSLSRIAKFFKFAHFDDLLKVASVVKTGGGGFHIYCQAPANIDPLTLRKCIPQLPGVDFKRAGGYVVAPGSRHSSGNYYQWENIGDIITLPKRLCARLKRGDVSTNNASDTNKGYGAFTGSILYETVLSKLDPADYNSNDKWEPLLMGSHYATAGEGIDEFIAWSLQDNSYADQENVIRQRWESLHEHSRGKSAITAGTLIHILKEANAERQDAVAALEFRSKQNRDYDLDDDEIVTEKGDWDYNKIDKEDEEIIDDVSLMTKSVDIESLAKTITKVTGEEGDAIRFIKKLGRGATAEEKMTAIRLINAASIDESLEAQEILTDRKIMTHSAITRRLKALEGTIVDSLSELLANTTIDVIFKRGKHIVVEPNSQVWIFRKTHWLPISILYLGKIIYSVLDMLKTKMEIKAKENIIVNQAKNAVCMRSSSLQSKIFNAYNMLPIINCKNGELWINKNGSPLLRPHHHQSYQIHCLDVIYDPSLECPLFNQTIHEIFAWFKDCDDIVRHMWEILGYIIQPYKPDAQWWLFKGPGGDGKSLIIKVVAAILGNAFYSADANILRLDTSYGDKHGYDALVGKLLICVEELNSKAVLSDSGLKMLSENRVMTSNPKQRDKFSFNYFGSLIMCSNSYPKALDTSQGMLRRANVIPFNQQFHKRGAADLDLTNHIISNRDEMGGILNSILAGYKRYRERGKFLIPSSCSKMTQEWFCQSNNTARFVDENILVTNDKTLKLGKLIDVYHQYLNWCHSEGVKSLGKNNLTNELLNFGLVSRKSSNVYCVYGGQYTFED